MSPPQVSLLQRDLRYPDGSLHYEVSARVISRGTVLPFVELFVLSIKDPLNPKSDVLARIADPRDLRTAAAGVYVKVSSDDFLTISGDPFVRIANIDELTTMARDRVTAVRRGSTEYLASTISVIYDQMTTADAAGRQIIDRLSSLTTAYVTAHSTFLTDPAAIYSLPVTSRSVEAVLTAAYVTQRNARIAAEAAQTAARAAVTACQAEDATLDAKIDMLVADVSFLEAARSDVVMMVEACVPPTSGVTATNNTQAFVLDAGNARSYETLLGQKRTALAQARDTRASHDAGCRTLALALGNADAAVAAARTAENNALSNVYASCPTFNPNTV